MQCIKKTSADTDKKVTVIKYFDTKRSELKDFKSDFQLKLK